VVAKRLAKRLEALGAKQLTPLGLGDDQVREVLVVTTVAFSPCSRP